MTAFLTLDDVQGGYDTDRIIRGVSAEIARGDFVGVIGPNGSGKTTLLRLLSGVLRPKEGTVSLEGEDLHRIPAKELSRRVAFVQQDTVIQFPFSVGEIVLLGRIPHLGRFEKEKRGDYQIAETCLAVTDTLALKDKMINALSSGERQRVLIAKALAQQPLLLFLDEPTAHLDIGHKVQIMDLLERLNTRDDLTIVMALHDLNLAGEYCNRIILLDAGLVHAQGEPEEVITYQNIERVYKTVVVERKNPITGKPFIVPVSGHGRGKMKGAI